MTPRGECTRAAKYSVPRGYLSGVITVTSEWEVRKAPQEVSQSETNASHGAANHDSVKFPARLSEAVSN